MCRAMTTTERPPLPPVVCAPWCEHGHGHANEMFRGDQTCWGPSAYVDLSLEDIARDDRGVYPQKVGVMAYRHWREGPCVYVHLEDIELSNSGTIDHCLHLTSDEARALAAGLLRVADQIEGGTG